MPSRVGRVTKLYEDGTCNVINELTSEEWYGRLIVMSGGMICFDLVDERLQPIGRREVHPERGGAREEAKIPQRTAGSRVSLGGKKEKESAAT